MRIIFLCSSLESGRDGVGDYTRRLAGELIYQHHQVSIIALNDPHISTEFFGTQDVEGNILTVLRLPSNLPIEVRFKQAKVWIDKFNPDWLSLQFVAFGFQRKGLPFRLSKWLSQLGEGRRWHIMFHELWVGMHVNASIKLFLWGRLQQQLIQNLLWKLRPFIVHTQSKLYQMQLAKIGTQADLLPLFSNIPVYTLANINISNIDLNKEIKFVLFGSIHPESPVEEFVQESLSFTQRNKTQLSLTIIGRAGEEQKRWADTWRSAGFSVDLLGEQSPERISAALQNATIGISTTVFSLIEKSGSVAAMLEHGLPVICVAKPWQSPENISLERYSSEILEYQQGNLEKWLLTEKTINYTSSLSEIAKQFVKSLMDTY